MLDTVKMHPLLVTASKEAETLPDRWKNKGHHDVIVECAKFALERINVPTNRDGEKSIGFKSSIHSHGNLELAANLITEERPMHATPLQSLRLQADLWSPSLSCGLATPPPNDISLPLTPVAQVRKRFYSSC
jgi:tuberous sclerosis protein 1